MLESGPDDNSTTHARVVHLFADVKELKTALVAKMSEYLSEFHPCVYDQFLDADIGKICRLCPDGKEYVEPNALSEILSSSMRENKKAIVNSIPSRAGPRIVEL